MQFDQGFGERQAEPGSLVLPIEFTIDLLERGQGSGNVVKSDANTCILSPTERAI